MRLKKAIALLLASTMTVGMLTGCGSSSSNSGSSSAAGSSDTTGASSSAETETKDVTLTVWGPQEDQAPIEGQDQYKDGILKYMCDKFNEEHPEWNITFNYGVCSEGDAQKTVTKDLDNAADVYMYANDQIPSLVDAGALSQIGGTNADAITSTNDETTVSTVTYKDGLYGAPFTSNTWFLYYDKSKFTEDDVKSLDTMMAKDLGDGVTNFAFPLDNSWYIEAFYYAAGGTLFGENGDDETAKCDWDSDAGIEATKYMAKLAANPKFSNEKDGSSIAKFKDGKLGAYCSGSWDAQAIKDALGDNFACAQLPTVNINGQEGQMRSFAGSKAIGVNPNCKDQDVAVALAVYLGSEECQKVRFEARGIIPTNTNLVSSDDVKNDAVAAAQAAVMANTSKVQPMVTAMGSYWDPAASMGGEIVNGKVNDDNAAEKTKKMVEGINAGIQ
ncbi:MAG: extracellular solute-binding protein [Lachnospiraceae bacterium]|nr:extracellular solute-binding protein [Lachnospiraceae bacterium]MEE3461437.1 extracellular solute-binding protein [Lachnospiraceae bacterium]